MSLLRLFLVTALPGLLASGVFGVGDAAAQAVPAPGRAAIVERLTACRAISDPGARLACFDRESAVLDQAERAGDVVVVDREQVRETRRALFGFSMPSLAVFDRGAAPERIEALTTTLRSARQVGGRGPWLFELENGAVWRQIDDETLGTRATPGSAVVVRSGAIGSFLLSVNGARSLRVRRER